MSENSSVLDKLVQALVDSNFTFNPMLKQGLHKDDRLLCPLNNEIVPKIFALTAEYVGPYAEDGLNKKDSETISALFTLADNQLVHYYGDKLEQGEILTIRWHEDKWVVVAVSPLTIALFL